MELDEHAAGGVGDKRLGELAGEVGLAGAGGAVEDDLALVGEERDDVVEEGAIDEEVVGEIGEGVDFRSRHRFVVPLGVPVQESGHPPRVIGEEALDALSERIVCGNLELAA